MDVDVVEAELIVVVKAEVVGEEVAPFFIGPIEPKYATRTWNIWV